VVTVNGKPHEPEPGESVARLLERIGFSGRYALVERNGEPVERDRYRDVLLEDGDTLVVARPVAGG
jgi:thiamine biosynthesis protein ThiS